MRDRLLVRHLIVAVVAVGFALLGFSGRIGERNTSRIDQWQVSVSPSTDGGLDITETIDLDLADDAGHGLQLRTGTEFGTPQNLMVRSPDAPTDVTMTDGDNEVTIRIGDPDIEIVGQHRYEVGYTLRNAPTTSGELLALDVMVGSPLAVTDFRATIVGIEFDEAKCYIGERESTSSCAISARPGGGYDVLLTNVAARQFVTVEGTVVATVDTPVPEAAPSPPPQRRAQWPVGLATGVACLVGAGLAYLWCSRKGSNEVFGDGGATEAAWLPHEATTPSSSNSGGDTSDVADRDVAEKDVAEKDVAEKDVDSTRRTAVSDTRLAAMATTEFEPPPGIEPWEGLVLLTERFVNEDVFNAYLSGLAGQGAIEIVATTSGLSISAGPNLDAATPDDRRNVKAILAIADPYRTGTYEQRFHSVYKRIHENLRQRLTEREWWYKRPPPSESPSGLADRLVGGLMVFFFALFFVGFPVVIFAALMADSVTWSVFVSAMVGTLVGLIVYRVLLRRRTAIGSALTLRTESFRRFLVSSEANHVEWAWERGLVREYSGWAVGLGAASAWSAAIEAAARTTPALAAAATAPFLLDEHRSSIDRSLIDKSSGWTKSSGGSSGSDDSDRGSSSGGSAGSGGGGSSADRW